MPGSSISRSVAEPVNKLTGLKHALPSSFFQTSVRMSVLLSASKPAARSIATSAARRTVGAAPGAEPGSPKTTLLPEWWRATPGSGLEQAGYTTAPSTACAGMAAAMAPVGSVLASAPVVGSPLPLCVNHQGTPLSAGSTSVSGPSSGWTRGAISASA